MRRISHNSGCTIIGTDEEERWFLRTVVVDLYVQDTESRFRPSERLT